MILLTVRSFVCYLSSISYFFRQNDGLLFGVGPSAHYTAERGFVNPSSTRSIFPTVRVYVYRD